MNNSGQLTARFRFADRLQSLRKEKGLTQKQLAERLNMSISTLIGYENAQRFPSSAVLTLFEREFQTSREYLLGDSDVRNPECIWKENESVEKISEDLPTTLAGLHSLLRKCTDEDRDNTFIILQELGHVLKIEDQARRTASLTLFQRVFGSSSLFLDACLNSVGDLDSAARLERTKERTVHEYENALTGFLDFFLRT